MPDVIYYYKDKGYYQYRYYNIVQYHFSSSL